MEEIRDVKSERQVCKIVNRERKRILRVDESIEMEEWDKYFRDLLERVEWRAVRGLGGERKKDQEEELRKEVKEIIRKLKDGKHGVGMGLRMRYGSTEVKRWKKGLGSL